MTAIPSYTYETLPINMLLTKNAGSTDATLWLNYVPKVMTAGILMIDEGLASEERTYFAGVTDNGDGTCQLTGCIRGLPYSGDTQTPVAANQFPHTANASNVRLVLSQESINKKGNTDLANTWILAQTFSAVPVFSLPQQCSVYASLAALQSAYAAPPNGLSNVYCTAEGQYYDAVAGSWQVRASGSNPNASTTVAGKVQEATVAQQGTATGTGSTGARLFISPANLITVSSGAADQNKIALLNASGQFPSGFIAAPTNGSGLFGDGSDGNVVISGNTSASRDMYYNNLTINTGVTLNPNGYRIFVAGTLTLTGTGVIAHNGNAGTIGDSASGATLGNGGAAGAALAAGYFPATVAGVAGGGSAGSSTDGQVGTAGTAGIAVTNSLGASGVAGGNGGTTPAGAGGAGGAAGAATVISAIRDTATACLGATLVAGSMVAVKGSGGSGAGGSGRTGVNSSGTRGAGGAGGGSGSGGGYAIVVANIVTGSGSITATGGAGGNGGAAANASGTGATGGGGGGGGSGGPGGVAVLIYRTLSSFTGTITAAGGAAGTGGALGTGNGGNGGTGVNGSAGTAGYAIQLQF